jgi:Glycosyltransferase family 87
MTSYARSRGLAFGSPIVRRAVRDGLVAAGLLFAAYLFLVVAPRSGTFGFDAYAYWSLNPAAPYSQSAGALGAFTYTPVIAWLFTPFGALPWYTFLFLWTMFLVATVIWLGWRSTLVVLALPPVALELYHGNVNLLIAAAIVFGFRWPATWSFVLLTKVTPGVGLLWFAVRREWKRLGIALGFTAALVAVSVAANPELWRSWLSDDILKTAGSASVDQFSFGIPLPIRLLAAAAIVSWGGLTDRPWTVPVAATLGLPILWPSGIAILAALWPIAGRRPGLTSPEVIGVRAARTGETEPGATQPATTQPAASR